MKNNQSLGKHISTLYRYQSIILNQELDELQLGSGQYIFLLKLEHNEGINLKNLSHIVKIDRANTSRAVKKLESLDYIKIAADKTDKRNQQLYLTKKAKKIMPVLKEKLAKITEIMSENMDENEINMLFYLLEKAENNITGEVDKRRNKKSF